MTDKAAERDGYLRYEREDIKRRVLEASGHLGAALIQSIPSDDAIIMGHVESAERELKNLLDILNDPS